MLVSAQACAQVYPGFPPPGLSYNWSTNQISQANLASCTVNNQSGFGYTVQASDANQCVGLSNGSNITVTIPSATFPIIGTRLTFEQLSSTGIVTIAPAVGVTINLPVPGPTLTLAFQYQSLMFQETATDVWQAVVQTGGLFTPPVQIQNIQTSGSGACLAGNGGYSSSCSAIPMITNALPGGAQKDFIITAGAVSSGGLSGNEYNSSLVLGRNGDFMIAGAFSNPVFFFNDLNHQAAKEGWAIIVNDETTQNNGLKFGVTGINGTACPPNDAYTGTATPAIGSGPCAFWVPSSGYPSVFGSNPTGSAVIVHQFLDSAANSDWWAIGGTTPTKWQTVTSTGTSQATVTTGDTNSTSIVYLTDATPTIVSGFGSGAAIVTGAKGCYSFEVNVGTITTQSTGVVGCTTAANNWACAVHEVSTASTNFTDVTAEGPSSATVTNFGRTTGTATAWTSNDLLSFTCLPH